MVWRRTLFVCLSDASRSLQRSRFYPFLPYKLPPAWAYHMTLLMLIMHFKKNTMQARACTCTCKSTKDYTLLYSISHFAKAVNTSDTRRVTKLSPLNNLRRVRILRTEKLKRTHFFVISSCSSSGFSILW